MKITIPLMTALLLAPSFCQADDLATVGLDKNKQGVAVLFPKGRYIQVLRQIVVGVHESTMPVLEAQESRPGWMLRDVAVGVGVSLTAGLGPIYSVTAKPRIRMIYSNSIHPRYPD